MHGRKDYSLLFFTPLLFYNHIGTGEKGINLRMAKQLLHFFCHPLKIWYSAKAI